MEQLGKKSVDQPDARSADSFESSTAKSTPAENEKTNENVRSCGNEDPIENDANAPFDDKNSANSEDDSFLSSSNVNYSEFEDFPLGSIPSSDNTKDDNLSEISTLRDALSVVYYQYLSMRLKLQGVCDNLKCHVSECDAVQSAVSELETILQAPSVLPDVIFPETLSDISPQPKTEDAPSSPSPSAAPPPPSSSSSPAPSESASSAPASSEESLSESSMQEAVDDLERAVIYNGALVDSLKELQLCSSASSCEDDLRQRLQILYTNNVLLTSIIDSNNTHTFEMSSLLSQKSDEVLSLKDELMETRSELTSLSAQFSKTSEDELESRQKVAWLEELTKSLRLEADSSSKQFEEESQKRIRALTETNLALQQEVRRLRTGVMISTAAGEFSSANPSAIIACIQGLTSRVALAEAKVETAERRYRVSKLQEEEEAAVGKLRSELQMAHRQLSEKNNLLREYKVKLGKLKQNEVSYKKIVSELRARLQQRQSELKEIYLFLQGS